MGRRSTGNRKTDGRKRMYLLPPDVHDEIKREAERLDRSLSWVMQRAWLLAREQMKLLPSMGRYETFYEKPSEQAPEQKLLLDKLPLDTTGDSE